MKEGKKRTEIVIAGFYGPYRGTDTRRCGKSYDYITRDIYEKIKELGINLILFNDNDYATDPEAVLADLKYASEYGIGVYIHDKRLHEKISDEQRFAYLSDYNGYKAFRGIALVDEPFTSYYDETDGGISKYQTHLERRMETYGDIAAFLNGLPGLCGNINLLPMIAYLGGEDYAEDYDRYVEEFIATCHPKVLSFDYYVFAANYAKEHGIEGYFANLAVIRKKALKYGLDFWNFIQTGANSNDLAADLEPTDNNVPSLGQLLWNVNTSLAYGAKGIEYFTLIQPYYYAYETGGRYDYRRNGLIGADGMPNKWYGYARRANRRIAIIGKYLVECVSKAILAVGIHAREWTGIYENSFGEVGIKDIQCSTPEEGAIVGVMDYASETALLVVNNDMEKIQTIQILWTERVVCREIREGYDGSSETDIRRMKLEPGDATLLIYHFTAMGEKSYEKSNGKIEKWESCHTSFPG